MFVGEQIAKGMVERVGKVYSRVIGELVSISPDTEVSICYEMEHSHYPKLLYIKPVIGAEDWTGAIAVPIHRLHFYQDGQPPQPLSAWMISEEDELEPKDDS